MYGAAPTAGNLWGRVIVTFSFIVVVVLNWFEGVLFGGVLLVVLGHINGSIFDVVDDGDCAVFGFGFGGENWIGKGLLDILAFNLNFCNARATITCSCSSSIPFCNEELSVC